MIVLANLLYAISMILQTLLTIMTLIVVIRALISWVNPDPYNPIVRFLASTTDPMLEPIRERLPDTGMFDLSPIVLLLLLMFGQYFLVSTLVDYSEKLRIEARGGISIVYQSDDMAGKPV